MAFQRFLVPVDYSDNSLRSLAFAADLALRLDAKLVIVHVWDRPTYVSDAVLVGHGQSQRPLGELIRENAQKDMLDFLSKASVPAGLVEKSELASGDPAHALLDLTKAEKYDLVIIGTHGRSGLAHLLLGSVAEKLIRHSTVPVLTVPNAR
jgi:universal stress protein A